MSRSPGLPASPEYFTEFINQTIRPALSKQSNSVLFPPGIGRNSFIRHLSAYRFDVLKQLGINLDGLVWLLIDTTDEQIITRVWRRMLKQQIPDQEFTGQNPADFLEQLTYTLNYRVLLCLWVTRPVDADWLEGLRQINTMQIDWQFGFPMEVPLSNLKTYLGSLATWGTQNSWYMPLYKPESIEAVITNQVNLGYVEIDDEQRQQIVELVGGYSQYARFFLRHPDQISIDAWNHPELQHMSEQIWDALSTESQQWLFGLLHQTAQGEPSEYLQKTKLVIQKNSKWEIFSPLFQKYLGWLSKTLPPHIVAKDGRLMLNHKPLDTVLTPQELDVFSLIWHNGDQITTRDQVAQAMWGDDWEQRYSDWGIDQMSSRIRKKLADRSPEGLVKTLKGQGFIINRNE